MHAHPDMHNYAHTQICTQPDMHTLRYAHTQICTTSTLPCHALQPISPAGQHVLCAVRLYKILKQYLSGSTLMCFRSMLSPTFLPASMSYRKASSQGAVYTPSGQNPCINSTFFLSTFLMQHSHRCCTCHKLVPPCIYLNACL